MKNLTNEKVQMYEVKKKKKRTKERTNEKTNEIRKMKK